MAKKKIRRLMTSILWLAESKPRNWNYTPVALSPSLFHGKSHWGDENDDADEK